MNLRQEKFLRAMTEFSSKVYKDHKLWIYISLAYFFLHAIFLIFLGKITAFGIDEDGYLDVFRNVYSNNYNLGSQLSWPTENKLILQIIHIPAKLFEILGVPDYLALRFQSTSIFYIACSLMYFSQSKSHRHVQSLLITFMFLPSIFLWSSLGLRESFIYLWLVMIWYASRSLIADFSKKHLIMLFLGMQGLATTKVYLYALFVIAAILVIVVQLRNLGWKKFFSATIIFLSPLAIQPGIASEITLSAYSAITNEFTTPIGNTGNTGNTGANRGLTLELLVMQLNDNKLLFNTLKKLGVLDNLLEASNNTDTESSEISKTTEFSNASLNDSKSLVFATLNFLILPVPFIDNGSLFLNLQSIESPILYILYVLVAVSLIRNLRKLSSRSQVIFGLLLFASLFIAQSALIEINLGTLVRHRSILTLCLILIYFEIAEKRRSEYVTQVER